MEFKVGTVINSNNVNLALINRTPIVSDDTIQIKDLSIDETNNQIPAYGDFILTTVNATGVLQFTNESLDTEITSYYNYIVEYARYIPLWKKHALKAYYYNNTTKRVNKTINSMVSATFYNLLPNTSEEIICENTITAYNHTISAAIPAGAIKFNPSKQTVAVVGYGGHNIQFTFHTIVPEILITDSNGDSVDKERIKLVVTKFETTPTQSDKFQELTGTNQLYMNHMYYATIYADLDTYQNTHTIEYKTHNGNAESSREEILNLSFIYNKVTSSPGDNEFTINSTSFVITTNHDTYTEEFFARMPNRNSKIAIAEPVDLPLTRPWFLDITNDGYIENSLTYYPLEAVGSRIQDASETPQRLSKTILRVVYKPLHVIRNSSNTIANIKIYADGTDVSSYITDADEENGLVYVRETMPFSTTNMKIEYQWTKKLASYEYLNLNPSIYFGDNDIVTKRVVVFMLPQEQVQTGRGRTIFHLEVHKIPFIYYPLDTWAITTDAAIAYINGTTGGRSNIHTLFPGFTDEDEATLNPIILGIVTVTNPYTAKSLPFTDIRYRGGGITMVQDENEYLDGVNRHLNDIAFWDGTPINLENIAHVKIPNSIRTSMRTKFINYHTDTIRKLRADPTYDAYIAVDDYINRIVTKYLRAGTYYILEYV